MTPTATTRGTTIGRRRPRHRDVLGIEVLDEMRGIYREPAALFFSVLMPVLFFALFASLFGGEQVDAVGRPVGTTMLATFGAYGIIGTSLLTPAIGLAEARERGWLRQVRVSPVPVPVTLAAKVIAVFPYCLGILTVMTGTAAALGVLQISVVEWLLLVAALLVGSLPFALIGLAVGAHASGNATTAILNALIIPMAIAGGLWFPLEQLPDWMTQLAQWLPTYHLSRLALAALGGGGYGTHASYVLGFAAVAGIAAVIAYRRSPT